MYTYLEYRNENLLISYPFDDQNIPNGTFPIQNNWWADIIFYSYLSATTSVYVSNINIATGPHTVSVTFSDSNTHTSLITCSIAFSDLVDNTLTSNPSYYGFSNGSCAVKLVFGTGLLTQLGTNHNVNYTTSTASLASSAVIMLTPTVSSLSFINNPSTTVKTYNSPTPVVNMLFHANTVANDLTNNMVIDVNAGAGTGLFDNCTSPFPTTNIVTINEVLPNAAGNLYLTPDPCYSVSILNAADISYYSSLDPNPIATYNPFSIPSQSPNTYNALVVGKSFLITNNCQPKCPPENIDAFAYYLNRVRDGIQELFEYADSPYQTIGVGTSSTSSTTFGANTFSSTYPAESGFIKYFHEGKTITLTYSGSSNETRTIETVVNANHVTLDQAPITSSSSVNFAVNDLGLFQILNDAIINYNTTTAANLNIPTGSVYFTSTEGDDVFGNFGTFLSIVVVIFNATNDTITFDVGTVLTGSITPVLGGEKVRYGETVVFNTNSGSINCKTYATWENIYFIPCGELSASVAVTTTRTWRTVTADLPGGVMTVDVVSAECAPVVTSADTETIAAGATFEYTITGTNSPTTAAFLASTLPTWASTDTNIPPGSYNIYGTSTDTTDTIYPIEFTVSNNDGGSSPFTLYLHVVAIPILSATNQSATYEFPFLYQIPATGFPTSYGASGLPPGLIINSTTGVISGTPSTTGVYGSVHLSATNIAGTGTQTITITVTEPAPVITSASSQSVNQSAAFYYQIIATNYPTSYAYTGTLPVGLSFSTTTGLLYGFPTVVGATTLGFTATNMGGTSSSFPFVVTVVAAAPTITSNTNVSWFADDFYTYQIVGTNNPTSYGATGLPSGLSVNTSTGIISGSVSSGTYTGATISATNGVGTGSTGIDFTFI